jgi:hypothetical protein
MTTQPEDKKSAEELNRQVAELRKQLATAIREDYERVLRNICEAKQQDKLYGYAARLVIRTIDRQSNSESWVSRSILECVEADFRVNNWWLRFDEQKEDIEQVIDRLFASVREDFSGALNSFVFDSEAGLPLYVLRGDGELMAPEPTNEDYLFVRLMLKHDAVKDDYYEPPPWSKSLYVRKSDIEAFWLFHGDGGTNYEQARLVRAAALRAYIAGDLPVGPTGSSPRQVPPRGAIGTINHDTKLLRVMQTARERYYGANFDPDDPDTLPKQTDVVAWLIATYALSKREAEAIDIVIRPDSSRKR